VRYRQEDQDCQVRSGPDGSLLVGFDEPQRAVAPGQFVVFYDGERCLGGAVIDQIGKISDAASAIMRPPGDLAGHG
jgi:tRNA-specific 2-thiouridylase